MAIAQRIVRLHGSELEVRSTRGQGTQVRFELPLADAADERHMLDVVGVNRVGKDGNGASYSGDSVALDFLGQVLGGDRGGDFVETVVLDRESLATFRRDFPVHLDADEFEWQAAAT